LIVVLFCFAGGLVSAQMVSDTATFADRVNWLEANAANTKFASVLADTIDLAENISQADAIRDRIVRPTDPVLVGLDNVIRLAAIYRSARALNSAADLYGEAYSASGGADLESLFRQAQILFELGDIDSADSLARTVLSRTADYSLKRRAYTLVARAAYSRGDLDTALKLLETLASLASDTDHARDSVEVESLVLLRDVRIALGDNEGSAGVESLIDSLFPESMASALLSRGRSTTTAGLPGTLALATYDENYVDEPARENPRFTAVQVGSFEDAENATHLVSDLVALGLDAHSDMISREGRTLHQVVVAVADGSTEETARIFSILHDNGFNGFLVY